MFSFHTSNFSDGVKDKDYTERSVGEIISCFDFFFNEILTLNPHSEMKLFFLVTKEAISTPVVHLERAPFDRDDTFLEQSINVFFFFFCQEINCQMMDLYLLGKHVRDCLEFVQTSTNVLI